MSSSARSYVRGPSSPPPRRGGVDRGRGERGVTEHRGDGRERDAGRHRRDAVAVPKPPGARLRALDAGGAHERAHLAVCGLPGDGPQAPVRAPHAPLRAPHPVHELQGLHQVLRHRNGPPVGPAALQGRDPDLVRLEVHVARAKANRFGDPASGHREDPGEGLHGGLRMRARHGEEPLALWSRQVLSPARADELAHHRPSPNRPSDPERYISVWELTTTVCRPPLSRSVSPAITGGPRPSPVSKRDSGALRRSWTSCWSF